jgi:hypothetical protein
MGAIRRLMALPRVDRTAYVEAGALDASLRLLTLCTSFTTARAWARRLARRGRAIDTALAVRAVEAAGRTVPGSNCLSEALTGWVLLSRAGADPALRVGVARDRALAAHAWVECDGEVVIGAGSSDGFSPLEGGDLMRT